MAESIVSGSCTEFSMFICAQVLHQFIFIAGCKVAPVWLKILKKRTSSTSLRMRHAAWLAFSSTLVALDIGVVPCRVKIDASKALGSMTFLSCKSRVLVVVAVIAAESGYNETACPGFDTDTERCYPHDFNPEELPYFQRTLCWNNYLLSIPLFPPG